MEEKKVKIQNSLWSIFGSRMFGSNFLRKRDLRNSSENSLGYTIVELIVVLGVLGILITVSVILINPASQIKKATDADRKADLKLLQSALEQYRANEGIYPSDSLSGADNSLSQCSGSLVGLVAEACPDDLSTASVYVQTVPKDPKLNTNYYYDEGDPVNGYSIYACLENTTDAEAVNPSNATTIKTAMGCNSASYVLYRVQNL